MTFDDLLGLAKNGQLLANDVVRETLTGEWKCASEVPALAEVTAPPRQSENGGEVTVPLASLSPVARWTPAIIAASVTAVVSVTACWLLLPQPPANVAVLPAGNTPSVASQQPPTGSSAPQATPPDKQLQPASLQTQTETELTPNAADSAAAQPDAPEKQPQPATPEIQPEKKFTPDADTAGSVEADQDSELRDAPSNPSQDGMNEEINQVNMAPATPSRDEPGHAEINAEPDLGPAEGKSSALSKIGLDKLDDPLADSAPNSVASGPNAPQKIARQEIASPSSTNSPAEDRLARLRLIYSRRAEILAQRNKIVAGINEATIERDAARSDQDSRTVRSAALDEKIQRLDKQIETLNAAMQPLMKQADSLRVEWLAIMDPFGVASKRDLQRELTVLSEWVVLDNDNDAPYVGRGFVHWQLGNMQEAIADFTSAVKLKGAMAATALAARGGALCATDRQKEGMADFGKALKINKAESLIYLMRGRAYCAAKKFTLARNDLRAAAGLDREDPEVFRNLALFEAACPTAHYRNGKSAVEHARKACSLTSNNDWAALAALAAAHAENGDMELAIDMGQRAAGLAWGEHKEECLAQVALYQAGEPLRLDWREVFRPAIVAWSSDAYWLDTKEGLRHNKRCASFRKTERGRLCVPDEGKPCPDCGG